MMARRIFFSISVVFTLLIVLYIALPTNCQGNQWQRRGRGNRGGGGRRGNGGPTGSSGRAAKSRFDFAQERLQSWCEDNKQRSRLRNIEDCVARVERMCRRIEERRGAQSRSRNYLCRSLKTYKQGQPSTGPNTDSNQGPGSAPGPRPNPGPVSGPNQDRLREHGNNNNNSNNKNNANKSNKNNRGRAKKVDKAKLRNLRSLASRKTARRQMALDRVRTRSRRPPKTKNPKARRQNSENSVNNPDDYWQGDTDLTDGQATILADRLQAEESGRKKRKIGQNIYQLWTNFPISYQFASNVPTATRTKIKEAIDLWEQNTCIRWQENGPNTDRLEFMNGGGCSSYVGYVGGIQEVSIRTPGCDYVGIIAHEIGHSLGFLHEQARSDRDNYITLNMNNVNFWYQNNFAKAETADMNDYSLPYDYGSVMHYDGFSFATVSTMPTIQTKDAQDQETIGQRIGPSFIDFALVNAAYCSSSCSNRGSCQHNGYPDPNYCNECKCPEGFSGPTCNIVESTNCGGELEAFSNHNSISSPNHPGLFPVNAHCVWYIKTDPGYQVTLQFQGRFEMDCKDVCDENYVEVKVGDRGNDFRKTGSRFCCDTLPSTLFTSRENEMIVIFRNYGKAGKQGFEAKYWSNAPKSGGSQTTQKTRPTPRATSVTVSATTTRPTWRPTQPTPSTRAPVTWWPTQPTPSTRAPFTWWPTQPTPSTRAPVTWWPTQPTRSTRAPFTWWPPQPTPAPTTPDPSGGPDPGNKPGCNCRNWGAWSTCSQQCGACGKITRNRSCDAKDCYDKEQRRCNKAPCTGRTFLWANGEFHVLLDECCIGFFKNQAGKCGGFAASFATLIRSFLPNLDGIKIPLGNHNG